MCNPREVERDDPAGFTQPLSVEHVAATMEAEREFVAARTTIGGPSLTGHAAHRVDPVRRRCAAVGSPPERPALPKISLVRMLDYGATLVGKVSSARP